jgi:L-threonylcarbamoyladenylate synthase
MDTRTIIIDPEKIDPQKIAEAADLIRGGQVVAFPTETVYGLGANATDSAAVARIYEAKGRPSADPVIVHIAAAEQLAEVAAVVPPLAQTLIAKFWPGPLTLVLARNEKIPPNVSANLPTVGVRMPNHPIAQALIKAAGVPIAAPSANPFGHTSPTDAHHVLDDLNGKIPLILDGGSTPIGVESTVLDLTTDPPQILRPGGVTLEALAQLVPNVEVAARVASTGEVAMPAPGMMEKHYAPHAELRLFEGADGAVRRALISESNKLLDQGKTVGLLVANDDKDSLPGLDNSVPVVTLGPLEDLEKVAKNLYAGMRKLDVRNVDVILARSYPTTGIGGAIRDRLVRAAQGKVTTV